MFVIQILCGSQAAYFIADTFWPAVDNIQAT